jgi:hypothetical protein
MLHRSFQRSWRKNKADDVSTDMLQKLYQNHERKGLKTLLILLNPSMGSILFTSFKQVSETNLRLRKLKYVVII